MKPSELVTVLAWLALALVLLAWAMSGGQS